MTKEEYTKRFSSSEIGLCEICIYFRECAKKNALKSEGCGRIETDRYSDQY